MWSRIDYFSGFFGFFVPCAEEGEDLDLFYKQTIEVIESQIWLICMTVQGWSYNDVLNMSEDERVRWVERCEAHQEKLQEQMESSHR